MEVIVGDATGRVSEAVVQQAISIPGVSHIFALTSRQGLQYDFLPHKKVTMIHIENFADFPPVVLNLMKGARLCIWSGRCADQKDANGTLSMAEAFLHEIALHLTAFRRFRFIYCSERWVEWSSRKDLMFNAPARRVMNEIETSLYEMADRNPVKFDVMIARPSGIMKESGRFKTALGKLGGIITIDRLAEALLKLCNPDVAPNGDRMFKTSQLLRL